MMYTVSIINANKWYKGMLVALRFSDSGEVEGKVSFDDEFNDEFIRMDDIRPIESINQSPDD